MSSRRWVFTLNNYTADEHSVLTTYITQSSSVVYGVVGKEVGQNGTHHLQCFVILDQPQRLSFLRRRLSDRAHYERALGTSAQASDYCKKDGDYFEWGDLPTNSGQRTDLHSFIKWGIDFIASNGRAPSSPEIARERPIEYLRYPRAVNLFASHAPAPQLQEGVPVDWQRELAAVLDGPANDRSIMFYVDPLGGAGKTWFQHWYLTNNPEKVQVLSIGKRDDLAFMIDPLKKVFFFNVPRTGMEFLQYTILEQLKDRIVHSFKYHSRTKFLHECPHVVVFCNEAPDLGKLSQDRYDIHNM